MFESSSTLGGLVSQGVLQMGDGYRTKSSELGKPGLPILRVGEVLDGRIAPTFKDHVRSEFRTKMGMKTSEAGDVVVTTKGTVGRVAQIPSGAPEFVYSPQVCYFRVMETSKVDPGWLYSWFRSPEFKQQADAVASQTDMAPYINLADMRRIRVTVPPLPAQRRIASVVGALDAKLRQNQMLTRTTHDLAKTQLQAAAGSGSRTLLGHVADVRKGLSYKGSGLSDSGVPMVNLANAAVRGGFKRTGWKYYTGDFKARHLASSQALLVANTDLTWKLEALGWPMLVPDDVEEALFSQDISIVDFQPAWEHLRLPTWAHLFTTEARQRVEALAYGTTVARFAPEALTGLSVPTIDRMDPVLADAQALLARGWAAERESERLIRLRDALLPGLMSGLLRIQGVEELVGEAV